MIRRTYPFTTLFLPLLLTFTFLFATTSAAQQKRTFSLQYIASVQEIPDSAGILDLWLPVPASSKFQIVSDIKITAPWKYSLNTEPVYGNRMAYFHINNPKDSVQITCNYSVTRTEITPASGYENDAALLKNALSAYTLIPLSDSIAKRAKQLVGKANGNKDRAEKLYRHTLAAMRYDKSGTGWGRGDFAYACDIRKGNCTDFHSMFMGYCRNLGIPTLFEIGLSIPSQPETGTTGGYHCWAFFSNSGKWAPVDISEAWKDTSRQEYFFGSLDENRVTLSRGRDISLAPPQKGKPLNFFIFPYAELDGQPWEKVSKVSKYR